MTRKPIILDTSSNTDVDGLLASSLILTCPELARDVDVERSEGFIVTDSRTED